MNRRDVLLGGSAVVATGALTTTLAGCGGAMVRPPDVPPGPFTADSTAEEMSNWRQGSGPFPRT